MEHSGTPPGKNQNLFATLTVRTYVWIFQNWTLQKVWPCVRIVKYRKLHTKANSTYETARTRRSVFLAIFLYRVQFGMIHTYVRTVGGATRLWFSHVDVLLCITACNKNRFGRRTTSAIFSYRRRSKARSIPGQIIHNID